MIHKKMDLKSSRETLDHSIMYIFAVALEDGNWHHIKSYKPERAAARKARLNFGEKLKRMKILNGQKYHDPNPKNRCFGGRAEILMKNGAKFEEEKTVVDAHPYGLRPFSRSQYINKFETLTDGIISKTESRRFLKIVQNLKSLQSKDIKNLNLQVMPKFKKKNLQKMAFFKYYSSN